MRVRFKAFQSGTRSWGTLFEDAAAFATRVGPERLIGISQSEGRDGFVADGVVTVWYWDDGPERRPPDTSATEPDDITA